MQPERTQRQQTPDFFVAAGNPVWLSYDEAIELFFPEADHTLTRFLTTEELIDLARLHLYREQCQARLAPPDTENPAEIASHKERIEEFVAAELMRIGRDPQPAALLELFELSHAVQRAALAAAADFFKTLPEDPRSTALKNFRKSLGRLAKRVDAAWGAFDLYPAVIEIICTAPAEKARRFLLHDFGSTLEDHFGRMNRVTDSERAMFERLVKFLSYIKNEMPPGDDSHSPSSGKGCVYKAIGMLAKDKARWVYHDPQLRPILLPLMEEARADYLNARHPISATSVEIGRRAAHDLTKWVEWGYRDEREPLRQHALQYAPLGTLHLMAFGWGRTTCTEVTGILAGERIRDLWLAAQEFAAAAATSAAGLPSRRSSFAGMLGDAWSTAAGGLIDSLGTLQRALSRDNRQSNLMQRGFLQGANDNDIDGFIEVVNSVYRGIEGRPDLSALNLLKNTRDDAMTIDAQLVRKYFLGSSEIKAASELLSVLCQHYTDREVAHLLEITRGDSTRLTTFVEETVRYAQSDTRPFSPAEILAADSLEPLVAVLCERFRSLVPLSESDILPNFTAFGLYGSEAARNEAERRVAFALDQIFHQRSGMSSIEFQSLANSELFSKLLSGSADLTMRIAPTLQEPFDIFTPKDDLLRCFPCGLLPVAANAAFNGAVLTPEILQLRSAILIAAVDFLDDLAGAESADEICARIVNSAALRERFFALLGDSSFGRDIIIPRLAEANVQGQQLTIGIPEKSDPLSWNVAGVSPSMLDENCSLLVIVADGLPITHIPLWLTNNGRTLMLEYLPEPELFNENSAEYLQALHRFFARYSSGRVRAPGSAMQRPDVSQVVVAKSETIIPANYFLRTIEDSQEIDRLCRLSGSEANLIQPPADSSKPLTLCVLWEDDGDTAVATVME